MSRPPDDPALPRLALLLDREAMAALLAPLVAGELADVHIARVAYKPGRRVAVHYEATVGGRRADAVAHVAADRDLAATARSARCRSLAHVIDGRSPARTPVHFEPRAEALVTWLPFDLRLPALAETPRGLARHLRRAGLDAEQAPAEPTIVPESYKPAARIVLRFGGHILKAYGRERHYERAVAAAVAAASAPVPTAPLLLSIPELRLTVQPVVEGLTRAPADAAAAAGALLRRLQAGVVEPGSTTGADALLRHAGEQTALAARLVPSLAGRLERLVERLAADAPVDAPLVPAHGDFDADQLIARPDGQLVLIDLDRICLAPAALDVATYLADVVRGRGGDLDAIAAVSGPLLDGYGAPPRVLEWFLAAVVLCRAPHPFQRFVPGWPERVEGMVETAEAVLAT